MYAVLVCFCAAAKESEKDELLTKEGIDAFYQMCWQELQLQPPKIQPITEEFAKKELQGKFSYSYKDEASDKKIVGEFECKYPSWTWPDDHTKGTVMHFGNKLVLIDEGKEHDMRAFIVRIDGRWHIMQLDFPGGLVKLSKEK